MKTQLLAFLMASTTIHAADKFLDEEGCKRMLQKTARYSTNPTPSVEAESLFTIFNNRAVPATLYIDVNIQDAYGKCPKSFVVNLTPGETVSKTRFDLGEEFNSPRAFAEGVRIGQISIQEIVQNQAILLGTISQGDTFTIKQ